MRLGGSTAIHARSWKRWNPRGSKNLGISGLHAVVAASLPRLHGDPFDRMLIAQAQAESALLLTRDDTLTAYGGFVTLG